MNKIRLLPVVVMAIAALLVLKTLGLVTNGSYVLGVTQVAAAGGGGGHGSEAPAGEGESVAIPAEPTIEDISPTLADTAPTLAAPGEAGHGSATAADHGAPSASEDHGETEEAAHDAAAGDEEVAGEPPGEHSPETPANAAVSGTYCREADASITEDGTVVLNPATAPQSDTHDSAAAPAADHGGEATAPVADAHPSFAASLTDCLPSGDAIPFEIDGANGGTPLLNTDGSSPSEQQLLERLAARRAELQQYEQDLALRASIVDAAEKRIEERAATLEALEAQISSLVDQRQEMESGQFAGIVAMYETMKPKDAANIFNALDIEVLLRVAKTMSPRKMAPILAEMDPSRAQELTVRMASLADKPAAEMTAEDLAALPQIVGQ